MSLEIFNRNFKNTKIDTIGKIFIFIQLFLGISRLRVFDKVKYVFHIIVFIYYVCLYSMFCYWVIKRQNVLYISQIISVNVIVYFINSFLAFLFCNKYCKFFDELNSFDMKVGLRSRISSSSLLNVLACCVIIAIYFVFNITAYMLSYTSKVSMIMSIKHIVCAVELFNYGHLMTLLLHRLEYIKKAVNSCIGNASNIHGGNQNRIEQSQNTTEEEIRRLVLFYYNVIKAYDILNAAIKYQFMIMLLESFVTNILFWNLYALDFAANKLQGWKRGGQVIIIFLTTVLPFFSPCHFATQLKVEVCTIADIIRSNLHKLVEIGSKYYVFFTDKKKRNAAKLLLSLTNARTLSFSLFRMINVDILLPFKTIGYIATYLIVIMQFEKITGTN
nr:gustatory receptor 19 [Papilio dardanus]